MEKLLPCPFCGGEACMQEHVFVGYSSTLGVVCLDCCAETRQFYMTKDEAIAAWNRRAKPDAVPVVRGEWEVDEFGYKCSACEEYCSDYFYEYDTKSYCPSCGARMDGDCK